jgi:hypothetical protein
MKFILGVLLVAVLWYWSYIAIGAAYIMVGNVDTVPDVDAFAVTTSMILIFSMIFSYGFGIKILFKIIEFVVVILSLIGGFIMISMNMETFIPIFNDAVDVLVNTYKNIIGIIK